MLILECSQGCYGRTDGSVTISLRNLVGEGIIICHVIKCRTAIKVWFLYIYRLRLYALWCLTPLSTIFQLYRGGQLKPPTCRKSVTPVYILFWLENKRNIVQHRFSKEFILETVNIILEKNVFYFDGKFYRQKRGTAMGTKMAPTYATLVLGYIEHILYEQLLNSYGQEFASYIR